MNTICPEEVERHGGDGFFPRFKNSYFSQCSISREDVTVGSLINYSMIIDYRKGKYSPAGILSLDMPDYSSNLMGELLGGKPVSNRASNRVVRGSIILYTIYYTMTGRNNEAT